jgi:hypothetical protein
VTVAGFLLAAAATVAFAGPDTSLPWPGAKRAGGAP